MKFAKAFEKVAEDWSKGINTFVGKGRAALPNTPRVPTPPAPTTGAPGGGMLAGMKSMLGFGG